MFSASDLSGLSCSRFGVLVELNIVTHDDVGCRTAVDCEAQRTKDGPLRNADIESDGW